MHFGCARAVASLAIFLRGSRSRGTDKKLEAMGSVMRPANTGEHMERLRLLPSSKSVARTKGGGH